MKIKAKLASLSALAIIVGTQYPIASKADVPEFVGNVRQLEPGMHPVVITPARSGDLAQTVGKSTLYTGRAQESAITYTYSGAVLTNPKVYLIWYGSWNASQNASASSPIANDYAKFTNQFLGDMKTHARWQMNNSYYYATNKTNKSYINNFDFNSSESKFVPTNQNSYPEPLTQDSIQRIASDSAGNAYDVNGIYLVITSSNVLVNGFNAGSIQFCGWHTTTSTTSASGMKYGFVGDSANATWCQGQTGGSPNGAIGADSMISVLLHEIEEAVTDPNVIGMVWRDSRGYENADKCAWTWGSTKNTNNAFYNITGASGTKYLIQQGFKLGSVKYGAKSDTWSGSCRQG